MEGLRNFTNVDNHGALEVRHLSKGAWSFKVRRPKEKKEAPRC